MRLRLRVLSIETCELLRLAPSEVTEGRGSVSRGEIQLLHVVQDDNSEVLVYDE
jgi:hypothetical protein